MGVNEENEWYEEMQKKKEQTAKERSAYAAGGEAYDKMKAKEKEEKEEYDKRAKEEAVAKHRGRLQAEQKTNIFGRREGESISGHIYVKNNFQSSFTYTQNDEEDARVLEMHEEIHKQWENMRKDMKAYYALLKERVHNAIIEIEKLEKNNPKYPLEERQLLLSRKLLKNHETWLLEQEKQEIRRQQEENDWNDQRMQMFNPYFV
jgi:hypothetical protein